MTTAGEGDRLPPEGVPELPDSLELAAMAPLDQLASLGKSLAQVAEALAGVAESARETRALAVRLEAYSRRNRQLTVGLTISLVLDVALTTVVTLLSLSALNQGDALHTSQLAACSISNQTRVEQEQLWVYILQEASPPKTAAERASAQKFLAHVDATFAPVNCEAVYR
jgi:hypothetical protein